MVEPHRMPRQAAPCEALAPRKQSGSGSQRWVPMSMWMECTVGAVGWKLQGPALRSTSERRAPAPGRLQIWQEQGSSLPRCTELNQLCSVDLIFFTS